MKLTLWWLCPLRAWQSCSSTGVPKDMLAQPLYFSLTLFMWPVANKLKCQWVVALVGMLPYPCGKPGCAGGLTWLLLRRNWLLLWQQVRRRVPVSMRRPGSLHTSDCCFNCICKWLLYNIDFSLLGAKIYHLAGSTPTTEQRYIYDKWRSWEPSSLEIVSDHSPACNRGNKKPAI